MNIVEMHAAVAQGVDKVHAQVADTLLISEIDLELNKAIQQFVSSRFQKNNKYSQGFEESQKRRDDLRTIVVESYIPTVFKEELAGYDADYPLFVDTFDLPSDYMFYINLQTDIWKSNRCVALPYTLDISEGYYYFALPWKEGVGGDQDGLSTMYVGAILIADRDPDFEDMSTSDGEDVEWYDFWRWGESWNDTPNAFTSENPQTVYPGQFTNVLKDILRHSRGGLLDPTNPDPGNYWDGVGADWEELDNIVEPKHVIIPFTEQYFNTLDINGNSIYSADQSNGWLSYMCSFREASENSQGQLGSLVYQTPLRQLTTTNESKRYPVGFNSQANSWTNVGIIREIQPVKLVQFDDVYVMVKDPFNKTKNSSPLATMRGNHVDIYTDETFITDRVKLTYIRRPAVVQSPSADCDLPDHTHEEIVKMAVSSILEGISDPRYKSHQQEVDKME
tara:strand:- start:1565 stop:2911 length:1347 start_codon:yes stop_codon:yes gene_type:complete